MTGRDVGLEWIDYMRSVLRHEQADPPAAYVDLRERQEELAMIVPMLGRDR